MIGSIVPSTLGALSTTAGVAGASATGSYIFHRKPRLCGRIGEFLLLVYAVFRLSFFAGHTLRGRLESSDAIEESDRLRETHFCGDVVDSTSRWKHRRPLDSVSCTELNSRVSSLSSSLEADTRLLDKMVRYVGGMGMDENGTSMLADQQRIVDDKTEELSVAKHRRDDCYERAAEWEEIRSIVVERLRRQEISPLKISDFLAITYIKLLIDVYYSDGYSDGLRGTYPIHHYHFTSNLLSKHIRKASMPIMACEPVNDVCLDWPEMTPTAVIAAVAGAATSNTGASASAGATASLLLLNDYGLLPYSKPTAFHAALIQSLILVAILYVAQYVVSYLLVLIKMLFVRAISDRCGRRRLAISSAVSTLHGMSAVWRIISPGSISIAIRSREEPACVFWPLLSVRMLVVLSIYIASFAVVGGMGNLALEMVVPSSSPEMRMRHHALLSWLIGVGRTSTPLLFATMLLMWIQAGIILGRAVRPFSAGGDLKALQFVEKERELKAIERHVIETWIAQFRLSRCVHPKSRDLAERSESGCANFGGLERLSSNALLRICHGLSAYKISLTTAERRNLYDLLLSHRDIAGRLELARQMRATVGPVDEDLLYTNAAVEYLRVVEWPLVGKFGARGFALVTAIVAVGVYWGMGEEDIF
ncbi:hypothetical protein FOL47_007834 [Perkinsus chesapeaki]|uniref:Uncharacterized protein n=1 Tax=Perkinsus chesapeaki TaxID=330153 RepID=A0A7J6MVB8_PERCH|nr:hypothetical protein FOL47_007834 [Perkinsus chesapeaki]